MIEKLRDVSVSARTIQRDQEPEDVVGAVIYLCGPVGVVRHRPDDRHRRRPVLPLRLSALPLRDRRRDDRRQARRLRPRARRGAVRRRRRRRRRARLAARPRRARGGGRAALAGSSSSTRSPTGSSAATGSTSRSAASRTCTPIPGRGSATCSRASSRSRRRGTHGSTGPAAPGSRAARSRWSRARRRTSQTVVRPRARPARGVGGEADDPLRRARPTSDAPKQQRATILLEHAIALPR